MKTEVGVWELDFNLTCKTHKEEKWVVLIHNKRVFVKYKLSTNIKIDILWDWDIGISVFNISVWDILFKS
jgi:hypothetical protein